MVYDRPVRMRDRRGRRRIMRMERDKHGRDRGLNKDMVWLDKDRWGECMTIYGLTKGRVRFLWIAVLEMR